MGALLVVPSLYNKNVYFALGLEQVLVEKPAVMKNWSKMRHKIDILVSFQPSEDVLSFLFSEEEKKIHLYIYIYNVKALFLLLCGITTICEQKDSSF